MRHLDLCSGIGGIAITARWANMETVAFCEIDKFCQSILKKYWPEVPIIDDMKELTRELLIQKGVVNYDSGRTIDIITAGIP